MMTGRPVGPVTPVGRVLIVGLPPRRSADWCWMSHRPQSASCGATRRSSYPWRALRRRSRRPSPWPFPRPSPTPSSMPTMAKTAQVRVKRGGLRAGVGQALARTTPRRLEHVAGVARGFCFEPAGFDTSSGVDVAAEATERERRATAGLLDLGDVGALRVRLGSDRWAGRGRNGTWSCAVARLPPAGRSRVDIRARAQIARQRLSGWTCPRARSRWR
jgi:hypothetical protein